MFLERGVPVLCDKAATIQARLELKIVVGERYFSSQHHDVMGNRVRSI
jgi:hypothetical protein